MEYTEMFNKDTAVFPELDEQVILAYGTTYETQHALATYRNGGFELNNNGPYSNSVLYPFYDDTKGNAIRAKAWMSFERYYG